MANQGAAKRSATGLRPADWDAYRDNWPRHLIGIARDLQSEVMRSLVQERGFESLRLSFAPMISLLATDGLDGSAGSEARSEGRPLGILARELSTTKQSCSQLADVIEAAGYLARRPNPLDGRSKMLVLTERGRALAEAGFEEIQRRESVYAAAVGRRKWTDWLRALRALYTDLDFPTAVGPTPSVAVLTLIVDRLQQQLMESAIAKGHPDLKRSYAQILLLIGRDGGRISEMAQVQNVSRQAISAVSLEIEALGYLARVPDPRDRRARVLALSPAGESLIADSVSGVAELSVGFRARLGARDFDAIEQVGHDLYHALGLEETVFARSESP